MKKNLFFLFLIFTGLLSAQNIQKTNKSWKADFGDVKCFIENRGQFKVSDNKELNAQIKFAFDGHNERYLFTPQGVVIELINKEKIIKTPEERAARKERKKQGFSSDKEFYEYEKNWRKVKDHREYLFANWIDANPQVEIIAEQKNTYYHSYCIENESGDEININYIPSYNKLIYKNIYPNIDVIYEFHPVKGLKYSLVVKPGAELSRVKLQYSKNCKLLLNGTIETPTKFGDIIDHKPVTFYANNKNKIISSAYELKDGIISFKIGDYDQSKTIIIDPWTQTPNFPNTNWDSVWECERDGAGNVYIIGGTSPLELRKYNAAGVQQWIYNTTYDTTEWLGTFATDLNGISYVANGSPARIRSVSTAGATIWNNNNPGGIFTSTEFWNITFNCDQTQLVIAGTEGVLPPLPYIYRINMTNGNVINSQQVCGSSITPTGTQEVRSITPCNNGKYYFLTHDTIGYIHQSLSSCLQGGQPFHVNNGIDLGYKCENFRYNNTGIMALAYYNGFVFVHRGNQLQKRDFNTAAVVATANIPGGVFNNVFLSGNEVGCSGIDIDDCGNIYVGSTNGVYRFNQSLTQTGSFATSFNVYDVEVNSGGEVIACGSTGNQNSATRTGSIQSFAASACNPQAIVCCDATICNAGPLCTTDPAINLTVMTPGGTWSASCGTCINSAGTFNPSTAGAGTHTIIYTLGCGADSIQITVNNCSPLSVCVEQNGTLTVSGGTGPYTWSQWNPGGSTPITNQTQCLSCNPSYTWLAFPPPGQCLNGVIPVNTCNVPAGYQTYATGSNAPAPTQFPAQVQDNTGQTFTINNLGSLPNCTSCPTITVSTSSINQPACNGGTGSATVNASGGTGPYTYLWTPGNLNGATQNNLLPGTYTVTATDNNNCTGTTTVVINNPPAININVTNNTPATCGNSNGSITVSASGGTGTLSYSWSPSGQTGPTANNLPGGPHTVTVTDANGCTANQNITVSSTGGPTLSIQSQNNVSCFGGNDGSATISASGGQTPYSYSWSPSGGNNPVGTNLSAGTYTVTVTDAAGCVSTIDVTITQPASALTVSTTTTNSSCTANTGTATANPTGGTGPYSYSWNTSPIQNTQTANNLGLGTYVVTVTDANGCQATDTAIVTNPNAPSISLVSQSNVTCNGNTNGSATVSASGGTGTLSITWNTTPVQTGTTASNLPAGTYVATVTDQNSCSATVSITITEPAPLTVSISTSPSNCAASDGTATANASGGTGPYTYSWSNTATTQTVNNLPAGPISVNITDANGCTANATANITTINTANINAVPPFVTITQGESTTLTATGGVTYTWTPASGLSCTNCPNPTASPSQTTVYYVSGVDANGCFGTDSVIVYVDLPCGEIFVPNAFSPNNDGQNDKLCILGGCFLSLDFMIFDRWGEKVFEATSTSLCWDGIFRGKPMNPAVFYYILKATLTTGETIEKKGNITLIR
jgi:gliding motility-associated-like protein